MFKTVARKVINFLMFINILNLKVVFVKSTIQSLDKEITISDTVYKMNLLKHQTDLF